MLIRATILTLGSCLLAPLANATAQMPDVITLDGEARPVLTEPLASELQREEISSRLAAFRPPGQCSRAWRGYTAYWEVQDSLLQLVKVTTNPCDKTPTVVPLSALWPGQTGPVPATWVTATLVIPVGKPTRYVNAGYLTEFERYLLLQVVQGRVVSRVESTARPR